MPMKVHIKRINTTLPLPAYQTSGAAGFDIYSREKTEIPSGTIARIPTNLVIATPKGYMLIVTLRSSTPVKKGLSIPHGIGIIDSDYAGNTDEILLQVQNHTSQTVIVEQGERIGQGVFVKIEQAEWQEVQNMTAENRGGFGSTGI